MKVKYLFAILTHANLLLVHGLYSENFDEYEDTNFSRRILNGSPASVFDFPYLVAMEIGPVTCDGTIIGNQWILSAGHCISERPCSIIRIFPAVWERRQSVQPVECYNHPRYHRPYHPYDISLLRVGINFLGNGLTRKLPLPKPGTYYPPGTPAVIVGWGQTEDGRYPNHLLRADSRVEDWNTCDRKFIDSNYRCKADPYCIPQHIPNRVLCTQGEGFRPPGTCFGDSGGPVIINGVLAGVVSFGIAPNDKCMIGAPAMHVSVTDYIPWIYSIAAPEVDMSGVQVRPEN